MAWVIILGRPPPHRGAREAMPPRLNAWIISRTRSGAAPQAWAISEAVAPWALRHTMKARRTVTDDVVLRPRLTIEASSCSSTAVRRRTKTGAGRPRPMAHPLEEAARRLQESPSHRATADHDLQGCNYPTKDRRGRTSPCLPRSSNRLGTAPHQGTRRLWWPLGPRRSPRAPPGSGALPP